MNQQPEVVEAVRLIIGELHRLVDAGMPARRIDRLQREVIFFLYEGGEAAKWDFRRPHSAGARQLREQTNAVGQHPLRCRRFLTYDHAIPLATLREGLRAATASAQTMQEFLARHVRGVIIL